MLQVGNLVRAELHATLARASLVLLLFAVELASTVRADLRLVAPSEVGMDNHTLLQIGSVVAGGIERNEMPGCVVCIGRYGKIAFLQAYGNRQIEPVVVEMTPDTLFDLASLTKPVATATSIMLLKQQNKLNIDDRVASIIPEFAFNGKEDVTVYDLLTHQSGLIADNPLDDYADGVPTALDKIYRLPLQSRPQSQFTYSDVNYIVLGEIVRRVSGKDLAAFASESIFDPLEMTETGFLPDASLRERAAPTEKREGRLMQGEVHDPRAYALGGIAGHAGLFATAADLAIYATMMAAKGQHDGVQILQSETFAAMTKSYSVPNAIRGLGWDKRSAYSVNRGRLLSDAAFGHGGFTGTVLWIDPATELFVIFLSNRLHPDGNGSVNPLAGQIVDIAAGSIRDR